ncbi:hypothetical protein [Nostoc sp. FACHB-190]|nr:hypothetical protein [Nostoc sp. FACHB-190]MBD2302995.1 hypothetical protein [Nostoc sp. FACHB-190]
MYYTRNYRKWRSLPPQAFEFKETGDRLWFGFSSLDLMGAIACLLHFLA